MQKLERKLKTVNIKWKEYVEVKERIIALVENDSPYSIETDYEYFPDRAMWVVKAKLTMLETGESFTWLAQELESDTSSMVNKTSALENAETSAVWRACAFAWIWVIISIASADEVNKAINRSSVDQPNGKQTDKWFNFPDLEKCIKWWIDTEIMLSNHISENKYNLSEDMKKCLRHYCDNGELVKPEWKK